MIQTGAGYIIPRPLFSSFFFSSLLFLPLAFFSLLLSSCLFSFHIFSSHLFSSRHSDLAFDGANVVISWNSFSFSLACAFTCIVLYITEQSVTHGGAGVTYFRIAGLALGGLDANLGIWTTWSLGVFDSVLT